MEIFQIFCIILGGVIVVQFILLAFINHKYTKLLNALKNREVDNVEVKNGVRYTVDQTVLDEQGNVNISLSQKDNVLKMNKTEIVGIKNFVKPGKYTLLSTSDDEKTFNIRVGSYVTEYHHNQSIVLTEGQEVTAVNCSVILR
ncbi:MAG: hypothetical protein EOM55_00030 [Clostridia bacterium]|nr:hypothetical protein [Clostridia bacterium]